MRGVRSRGNGDALFGSAGWLFADLMLALVLMAILALTINQQKRSAPPPAPYKPTITTTTTTTPPVTTTTAPPELLQTPVHVDLEVSPNDLASNNPGTISGIQQYVHDQLAGPLAGRRVGFVLTFGTGSTGQITQAINEAILFNNVVLQAYGDQFAGAVYRSYFQGGTDMRVISVDLFVFGQ
jgi:hypothetical protein